MSTKIDPFIYNPQVSARMPVFVVILHKIWIMALQLLTEFVIVLFIFAVDQIYVKSLVNRLSAAYLYVISLVTDVCQQRFIRKIASDRRLSIATPLKKE